MFTGGPHWLHFYAKVTYRQMWPKVCVVSGQVGRDSLLCTPLNAKVAELADAQDSGSCGGNPVEVQVLSFAPRLLAKLRARRGLVLRAIDREKKEFVAVVEG